MPYYGSQRETRLAGRVCTLKTTVRLGKCFPLGSDVCARSTCLRRVDHRRPPTWRMRRFCPSRECGPAPCGFHNADPPRTSRPAARHPAPAKPISVIPKLYAVRTEARAVALTFDDGPDPRNTPQILDLLARYHVHATFFVLGSAAKHYPGIVRRSAAGGNEIGNHGWTHLHMTNLNGEQLSDQITRDANLITRLTSQRPTSFRPPYGDVNQTVVEVANALGETVVLWTYDTHDWTSPPSRVIAQRLFRKLHPGAVILLHNGGGRRGHTVRMILEGLIARKRLSFATLALEGVDLSGQGRHEVI